MDKRTSEIGRRALRGERLSRPDVLALTEAAGRCPFDLLYWAHRLRTARFGGAVRLCSIAAGKLGGCGEDCKFCAQSARHGGDYAQPKRTPPEEIRAAAADAAANKAASFGIVNAGRSPTQGELDDVIAAGEGVRADGPAGVSLCASLGALTPEQAGRLAEAGFRRYNHNLETSRRFFPQLVSTHGYDDRLRTLAAARQGGLSLCCGGIFGVGETWDDRVDLALTIRDEVRPDVVPLNFLHPIPGTPLAGARPLPPTEALAVIAVFRLVLPDVDLKIAGGREKNLRDLQSWMFYAGATSCLIGNYLTTLGRSAAEDLRMIADLGLEVVKELPTGGPA